MSELGYVIDICGLEEGIRCAICENPIHTDKGCDGGCKYNDKVFKRITDLLDKRIELLPITPEPHWIPVEQALPEEPFGCLVTVMDTNPVTMEEFENILPYFVGWDGEQWNDADGEQCPFEVLAWWRLPEPYKGVME